ncbi:VTT domain-containing protein [Candidatus Bathyarchaeota archaeon]|nr:VTT domain-containing protein [Candidatus Bathyarchaeota archaeon]
MFDWIGLGYIGVLIFSFLVNMLPFSSPSNMVLAAFVVTNLQGSSPFIIGVLVAIGSTLAKTIHYFISLYGSKVLNDDIKKRLENYGLKLGGMGAVVLFLTAASPIPDDPIIVALGVVKYNPVKFLIIFFSGKILITTAGALMGNALDPILTGIFGDIGTAIFSFVLTVLLTVVLVKVDLEKKFKNFWNKFSKN